jgi:hypothetical protein
MVLAPTLIVTTSLAGSLGSGAYHFLLLRATLWSLRLACVLDDVRDAA